MKVENPAALHFMMQDELYFLNKESDLYKNTALPVEPLAAAVAEIVPEAQIVVVEAPLPVEFAYLGKNKKNLLVLVHYPNLEFIAESHLTALENILKRKGFEMDDVAILNRAKYNEATFERFSGYFSPEKILLLGKNSLPGDMEPLRLNEPKQIANATALYSFSFDEMMDSNDLKKIFWEQMKLL